MIGEAEKAVLSWPIYVAFFAFIFGLEVALAMQLPFWVLPMLVQFVVVATGIYWSRQSASIVVNELSRLRKLAGEE